jgi:colanic acid/amylovoran biosynthesis glycosyltransferase
MLLHRFPELSQTFVLDQIAALESAGFDVRVFAIHEAKSGLRHARGRKLARRATFADRYPMVRLAGSPLVPDALSRTARRIGRQKLRRAAAANADLLICHFGPTGLAAVQASHRMAGAAPIWTIFHGYDLSQSLKELGDNVYRPLFEQGDRFLPISRLWADKLVSLGCPRERIQVVRMGVDCDKIRFNPPKGKPGQPLRILSVGRLVEKKGTEYSIRALAEVRRTSPELEWKLEVAGDGPLEVPLNSLAAELGVGDRISLLGPLSSDQIRERLELAHLFLLPSVVAADGDMEGIPVSLMEAMAAGVPVVSTVHSGIPELVENEVSGLLAPERDVATLASHIERLMRDPEERQAFADAARRKAEKEFDQRRINSEFAQCIRSALGLH